MKMSEILSEEEKTTIKSIMGDKVELSNGIVIPKNAVLPSPVPNTVTVKPETMNDLRPGMFVNTSEDVSEEDLEKQDSEVNSDIGGDPGDDFIDDIVSVDYERAARPQPNDNNSAFAEELDKMLSIAGLR